MKKSKKVALLITGSVVLAACRHSAPPADLSSRGTSSDWSSGASPTPSPSPTPSSSWHWWGGHGGGWHFWGSPHSSGGSGSWSSHSSSVSRGGFGSHGGSSGT